MGIRISVTRKSEYRRKHTTMDDPTVVDILDSLEDGTDERSRVTNSKLKLEYG